MSEINVFKLEVAIEKGFEEFMGFSEEARNPWNMSALSRKYAPRNAKQMSECLLENGLIFQLEAKPGYLLWDVSFATVSELIESGIKQRFTEQVQKEEMKAAKTAALRNQIMGG